MLNTDYQASGFTDAEKEDALIFSIMFFYREQNF